MKDEYPGQFPADPCSAIPAPGGRDIQNENAAEAGVSRRRGSPGEGGESNPVEKMSR